MDNDIKWAAGFDPELKKDIYGNLYSDNPNYPYWNKEAQLRITGKTWGEGETQTTKDEIVEELGGLPAPKVHCSMLGVEALHSAIGKYNNKKSK